MKSPRIALARPRGRRLVFTMVLLAVGLAVHPTARAAAATPVAERMNAYLAAGQAARGAETLAAELAASPDDVELHTATGLLEFAAAVERMGQAWYRHGLLGNRTVTSMVPFLRLPVDPNPAPEPISHEQARDVLVRFVDDLARADATLSRVGAAEVKLPLRLGGAHFDYNADGVVGPSESLRHLLERINPAARSTNTADTAMLTMFDTGDVYWLRGYTRLLSALLEWWLAHDTEKLFAHTAHLFFANPVTPYPFLPVYGERLGRGSQFPIFADAITVVHLLNFPLREPARSQAARSHLLQTVALSRAAWAAWLAETDDDREWIPNPRQTGILPGMRVTEDMIPAWMDFLDEVEALLNGERLLPFWRGSEPMGVNLERFLMAPQPFDLVLWIQGTAALPYLERGELTDPDFWGRLWEVFDGRFLGFALWFN